MGRSENLWKMKGQKVTGFDVDIYSMVPGRRVLIIWATPDLSVWGHHQINSKSLLLYQHDEGTMETAWLDFHDTFFSLTKEEAGGSGGSCCI